MKKIFSFSAISLLMAGALMAQTPQRNAQQTPRPPMHDSSFHRMQPPHGPGGGDRQGPGGRPGRNMKRDGFGPGHGGRGAGIGMERSRLNPEQQKQMKTIKENFHKQVAELQKNDKITMGEYRLKMAGLMKERKAKAMNVLTDSQKKQMEEGRKNAMINAQVRGAAHLERMKLTLGLTDEQVTKLKVKQTELHAKMKAIHENDTLLPEQKKEQMKALAEQQKENMKSVLTPEQLKKAEGMKDHFRGERPKDRREAE